jgi:hypothetical protein
VLYILFAYSNIGFPVPDKEKRFRQRMDKEKMEHALDFFFSPNFHQVSKYFLLNLFEAYLFW